MCIESSRWANFFIFSLTCSSEVFLLRRFWKLSDWPQSLRRYYYPYKDPVSDVRHQLSSSHEVNLTWFPTKLKSFLAHFYGSFFWCIFLYLIHKHLKFLAFRPVRTEVFCFHIWLWSLEWDTERHWADGYTIPLTLVYTFIFV